MLRNRTPYRFIAGAIFALMAVLIAVTTSGKSSATDLLSFLTAVGYLLIAASMFSGVRVLSIIGAAVAILSPLYNLIRFSVTILVIGDVSGLFISWAIQFLQICVLVLILLSAIVPRGALALGISAGALGFLRAVILLVRGIIVAYPLRTLLNIFLPIPGAILLGIAFFSAARTQYAAGEINRQLMNLNALLESGMMTREEYDARVKQLNR